MTQLTPELVDVFRRLDTCSVSNAVETFDCRLRNEGFTDATVRCLFEDRPPVVGHAVTARIHGSSPPAVGHSYYDRTDWWTYILTVPPPRIVVVEDADEHPGVGAFVGEVHANILTRARMRGLRHQRVGSRRATGGHDRVPTLCLPPRRLARLRAHRRLRSAGDGWRSCASPPATSCSAIVTACSRFLTRSSRRCPRSPNGCSRPNATSSPCASPLRFPSNNFASR